MFTATTSSAWNLSLACIFQAEGRFVCWYPVFVRLDVCFLGHPLGRCGCVSWHELVGSTAAQDGRRARSCQNRSHSIPDPLKYCMGRLLCLHLAGRSTLNITPVFESELPECEELELTLLLCWSWPAHCAGHQSSPLCWHLPLLPGLHLLFSY